MKDIRIFALNIPGTYPAWEINGEMMTGILSPSLTAYPKELEQEYKEDWIIEGENLNEIFQTFEFKKNLLVKKLNEDFNLLVYVIRVPDSISHRVFGRENVVNKYIDLGYKKIDNFIGKLINNKEIDNILIFSDHGLKFYKEVIHFPRFLEKRKLLYLNNVSGLKFNSIILKLYDYIRPFLRVDITKRIYNRLSISSKRNLEIKRQKALKHLDKDKPKSFIQKLTSNVGAIFLIGEDIQKKSLIKETLEKDKYVQEVIEFNITGFPDLMVILDDKYLFTPESSYFVKRKTETFSHTNRGMFIAYGKDIKKGNIPLINYQEIAPTILKLYNFKKPDHMEKDPINLFKT
jgi:predicted AlkP superfamily phosphohydrolase/phosphomutase